MNLTKKICFAFLVLIISNDVFSQSKKATKAYDDGMGQLMNKNYDAALAKFTEAIQLFPNYKEAYNGRGLVYAKKNRYDQAISEYIEANRHYRAEKN